MRYEVVIIYSNNEELIVDTFETYKEASEKLALLAKLLPERKLLIRVHEYEIKRL